MAFGVVAEGQFQRRDTHSTAMRFYVRNALYVITSATSLLSGNNQLGCSPPHSAKRSADACRKKYSERDCIRKNDQRNSSRKKPQFPYREQPPEKYLQKTECEQCPRSYEICYESGYCGFGGVLYLISPLPMQSLAASSYTTPN